MSKSTLLWPPDGPQNVSLPNVGGRCAIVFAQPGHELIVVGLMRRHRPDLLFLTRADSAGDQEREAIARHGIETLGLLEGTSFFNLSETDIFRWLFECDVARVLDVRHKVLDWLHRVKPTILFGDAFELTNVVHDLGRAVLDSAWREYRKTHPCENFELPLASRTEPELWKFHMQQFPTGAFETVHLDEAEVREKQSIADWVMARRPEAAAAEKLFCIEREVFRAVPPDRDYTVPPHGLRPHYDEWGVVQVKLGRYQRVITFADHFAPLIRHLPFLDPAAQPSPAAERA